MSGQTDRIAMERDAARTVDQELRGFLDDAGRVSSTTTVRVMGGDWTTVEGLLERAYAAGRADATEEIVDSLERRARWTMAASERVWKGSDYTDEKGMAWFAVASGVLEREAARLRPVEPPVAPPVEPEQPRWKQQQDENMRRLVEADRTETVYPRGVPTQVPRDRCRCPVMNVGDFCPVHGG